MSTVRWAEARGCLQHLHIALHEVLVQGSELATGIVKREHPDLLQAKLLQETLQPADPLSHCSAEVSLKFLRTARAVSAPLINVVLARKDNGRARFGERMCRHLQGQRDVVKYTQLGKRHIGNRTRCESLKDLDHGRELKGPTGVLGDPAPWLSPST